MSELVDSFNQFNPFILWVFLGSASCWFFTAPSMMLPAFTVGTTCSSGEDCKLTEGSIIQEFDLTGSRAFIADISTTAFMFGNIIGASTLARAADFFGRRPILIISIGLIGVAGLTTFFITNVYEYMAMRLVQGILFPGAGISAWVLAYESINSKSRSYCTLIFGSCWVTGYIILSPLAYFFADWRTLTIISSIPNLVIAAVYFFFLPESFYFLVSNKKETELNNWLLKLNRWCVETNKSGSEIINEHTHRHENEETPLKKQTNNFFVEIYSHKKLLFFTLIMTYLWVCDAICYYGLSLFSTELAGNKYINYVLIGLIELPSYIVSPWLLDHVGRRWTIAGVHFLSAVAFLGAVFVDYHALSFVFWLVGKFGIACGFTCLYVYAAEIFPTHLRNGGIGACEVGARVGGTLAPSLHTLATIQPLIPTLVFMVLAAVGGFTTLLLPETKGQKLPENSNEVENLKKQVEKTV